MNENNLFQAVYFNNKGYYFDKYIKDKIYTVETLLYKKPLIKTNLEDELNENEFYYIQFPSKNNIIRQLNKLKKTSFILELLPHQNEEKLILSSYFRIEEVETNLPYLLKIFNLNSKLEPKEVENLAKKDFRYKIIYCLLFVADELGLNPSYYIDESHHRFTFQDFREITKLKDLYPWSSKFIKHYFTLKQIPTAVFYDLLFYEIIQKENLRIKTYKKIIENNFNLDKKLYTAQEWQKIEEFEKNNLTQNFEFNLNSSFSIAYINNDN